MKKENKNKFALDQFMENTFIVFVTELVHYRFSLVNYPNDKNSVCVLPRLI